MKYKTYTDPRVMKDKIKLNHKCIFCNKEILISERAILRPRPFHFDCFIKELKEKVIGDIAFYNEESEELALKNIDKLVGNLK